MDFSVNHTYLMNLTVISKFDACTSNLKQYFCREEGIALLDKVNSLANTSGFIHRKKELVDKLNGSGMLCSMKDDLNKLSELIDNLPDGNDTDRMLFNTLKSAFDSFVSPAKVIEKLVKSLGDKEFSDNPVKLAILKQFLKYTFYHTAPVLALLANRKGRDVSEYRKNIELALNDIDESIFDILDSKLSKDDKKKYFLLRMVDDLANGRYKTNGSTKNALYMFAFAYNMTAFVNPETDILDLERDIEKKLFFDYYSNSYLRYISEDFQKRKSDYEAEPLGDGINYKNYVEVIYIYCLSLKEKTAAEKIKLAEKLIEACEKEAALNKGVDLISQNMDYTINSRYTYVYKDLTIGELMKLSPEDIPGYICTHYDVLSDIPSGNKITLDMNTKTAGYYYSGNKITHHFSEEDVAAETAMLKDMFPKDSLMVELFERLYGVLYNPVTLKENDIVHRSDIFISFFYKALEDDSLQGRSIYDLYIYMCTTLRPILMESRFQTVNSRNLFDMFVLVTLYRQINII